VKLVDISQLSEILSVKKKTIYDWTHKRKIPHVKMGRLVRFDPNDIERWIKRNSNGKLAGN
jgi:excisionase family DNA binding protein